MGIQLTKKPILTGAGYPRSNAGMARNAVASLSSTISLKARRAGRHRLDRPGTYAAPDSRRTDLTQFGRTNRVKETLGI